MSKKREPIPPDLLEALKGLEPGYVIRVDSEEGRPKSDIAAELFAWARHLGIMIEIWQDDTNLYVRRA